MLAVGTLAPEFTLPDQNGEEISLSDYRGQRVILYFYPKDMTSGCTKQACAFSELYPQFREKGAVVLGVSKDTVASHKRFEEKHGLPFTLLSDVEKEVTARSAWASSAPPTSSTRTASSSKPSTRSRRQTTLRRCSPSFDARVFLYTILFWLMVAKLR